MLAVIDANSFYVQAFFRETFVGISKMAIGPLSR
jgi:multidrug resistance efflux pump